MAIKTETITINVSDYTLNINGNSNVSGTISWSSPSLPSGYTIQSQTFSGTMDYGGSGKLNSATINGSSASEGSFNISLGTSLKTSVAVTGRGQNKNATGPLNFTGMTVTIQYQYEVADELPPPTITIISQSVAKISSVSGYDVCVVKFTSDQALSYWEARATTTGATGHGVGTLVESGTLSEGATGTINVENEELINGDTNYTISIFGQGETGKWSDDTE